MPRFLADHNFKDTILDGLRRRGIELEVTLSRAIGLDRVADPALLSIAAELDLIVLTHDRKTMTRDANLRVARGDDMPGLVLVPWLMPLGPAIEELRILLACTADDQWRDRVHQLPL